MLIDDIVDHVIAEDEDAEDEDATRCELRSKKRRDKNDSNAAGGSDDVPNLSLVGDQRDNQDKASHEAPVDVPMASKDLVPNLANTADVSGVKKRSTKTYLYPTQVLHKRIQLLPKPNFFRESAP